MPDDIRSDASIGESTTLEEITITSGPGGGGARNVVSKIRDFKFSRGGTNILAFPEDHSRYYFQMRYAQYSRSDVDLLKVNFNTVGSVYLPLPVAGMVDSHEVDYTEQELGLAGSGIQAGKNVASGGGAIDSLLGGLGRLGIEGADALTGGAAGNVTNALLGLTPNNFMTILLKGPRYKRHEFTWKLFPRNYSEADTINKIIIEINNKMAVSLAAGQMLYRFPHIFWCAYTPNPKYLYKMKPAVLESFSANYAPAGPPSFYHGRTNGDYENPPESVELRARFVELEFWLEGQFTESNNGFGTSHRNL